MREINTFTGLITGNFILIIDASPKPVSAIGKLKEIRVNKDEQEYIFRVHIIDVGHESTDFKVGEAHDITLDNRQFYLGNKRSAKMYQLSEQEYLEKELNMIARML